MFKVSLLPESYRKQLISKKNKDIILSVAVIVLVCMLIVYAGIAIRLLILKGQERKVNAYNDKINQRIEELSPYVEDYNALAIAQAKVALIKPVDITVLEFVSEVQSITPDYIRITAIAAPEWQKNQVCVIEGDLSSANSLRSADSMLKAYAEIIKSDEVIKDSIKELKIVNDMPLVNEENPNEATTYSFRIIVSLSGPISVDAQTGNLITTTTTTTTETTTETTTAAPEESTEATSIEPSTIGTGAPTEAPSEPTTGGTSNE